MDIEKSFIISKKNHYAADKEKALAEFNLIWALGAYQVILFLSWRVLLLPAVDLLSSTWSVHTVTARPLIPRP